MQSCLFARIEINVFYYGFSIVFNCQVFKIACVINRKHLLLPLNFFFLIGLISVKWLQSTKFKVKCFKYFINLEFCESIRKACDEYPSARISKLKLNVHWGITPLQKHHPPLFCQAPHLKYEKTFLVINFFVIKCFRF